MRERMNREDDVVSHLKMEILQELRPLITDNIDPMRHMDFLRSKYILSEDDCEEINGLPVRKRRASKFLDILCKKGPQAYDMFCRSLEYERTQIFILRELNQEYERRIRNYHEMFRTGSPTTSGMDVQPPRLRPPPCPLSLNDNLHSGSAVRAGCYFKKEHESTSTFDGTYFSSVQETGDIQDSEEKMKGQFKVRDLLCSTNHEDKSSRTAPMEHEDSTQQNPMSSRGPPDDETSSCAVTQQFGKVEDGVCPQTGQDVKEISKTSSFLPLDSKRECEHTVPGSHETDRKCLTGTEERFPCHRKGSPGEDDEPAEDDPAFFSSLPQSYIEVPRTQPLQCRTSNDLTALPETLSEPSAFWKQEGQSGNESSNQRDSGFSSRSSQEIGSSVEGNISCGETGLCAERTPCQADGSQLSMKGSLTHPQLKLGHTGLPVFLSISRHSDMEKEDSSQC